MNPAIDNFRVVIRQVDLTRPQAPMKVSRFGPVLALIYRLARRTGQEEDHGVEHVSDLLHQKESGWLVLVRLLPKILLKINSFLCVIDGHEIRNDRLIGITIVGWRCENGKENCWGKE